MISKTEQQDWLKRLCAGEEEAYRFFFKEYYQILGSFAQQYVKEEMIAEDIVNDVIYELYRNKKSFPDIVSLKSFLFTSIKHRSLNYIRGKKAQERYLQDPQVANDTEEFFLDAIIEEEVYFLMHKAITETNRRRTIQEAYNKEHGITPTTIKKAVRDLIAVSKAVAETEVRLQKDPESMTRKELTKLIAQVEKQMRAAAADLNFEQAAELRDKMIDLKKNLDILDK